MIWDWQKRRRKQSTQWLRLCLHVVFTCFLCFQTATCNLPEHCEDTCRWGQLGPTGIADLLRPLQNDQASLCRDYASRVVGYTHLIECGHVEIGEAVQACAFGEALADHCHRHKNAAVAIMIVSHVASIAVWFPLARLFVLAARSRNG